MSHSVAEMTALFDECDKSGRQDGKVSVHELRDGIKKSFCPGIDDAKVVSIFSGLDMDGDNAITKQEFIEQMCNRLDRRIGFTKKFGQLDADNSGSLTREEVKPFLAEFNIPEEAFDQCDQDSSGKISLEEFLKMI